MASTDVPRNPTLTLPVRNFAGTTSSAPSSLRATSLSSPHQNRGRGRLRARNFPVTRHINVPTLPSPAIVTTLTSAPTPALPSDSSHHNTKLANVLCSETPSRFSSPGDNFLFSLLNPVSYVDASHASQAQPCENSPAHPDGPYNVCTACCSIALTNIRSMPMLGQRQPRQWPFLLPLCNKCTNTALAYHPNPTGHDGCRCSGRVLGRWLCYQCRVAELEKANANWEVEKEMRTGFTGPGVVDGETCVASLGWVCRCGGNVEGGEMRAGRCAGCEGVVHWGKSGV